MRKLLLTLSAAVLAAFGAIAPAGAPAAFAAAPANPKVAIIVGATGTATPGYRVDADVLYAEAIKYSTNVVRVYSPNATWPAVKAAVNGASIVIYLGHGNGWPSPYGNDAAYTTKDGFGLNYDANHDGKLTDSELLYYGEPSIRTLTPAPNAVVLLFHLCYASGNSEPGLTPPTLAIARQRADNYGAAFLAAGARAVIAIGHSNDPYYVGALFTTRQTIGDYFANASRANGNEITFASARTPGATEILDPDSAAPSDFYRSLTGNPALRTEDVTGASYASTAGDPASIVVPGNASPVADGTPVYGSIAAASGVAAPADATPPTASLPASTLVRVDAQEPGVAAADGSPIYRIHADGGVAGWVPGSSLVPRDSAAPRVWEVGDGSGAFSPNGDGSADTLPLSIRLSESSSWTLNVVDGGGKALASKTGSSDTAALTWAPKTGSVADGQYGWTLQATDALGNGPLQASGALTVDTAAPGLSVDGDPAAVPVFSPNGDGIGETTSFAVHSTEPGTATATILAGGETVVDTITAPLSAGGGTITWDGRTSSGAAAPDGTYAVTLVTTDAAGNSSAPQTRSVARFGSFGFVAASPALFFPQDGDRLAPTTSLTYRLAAPATVTWTIVNAAGTVVKTINGAQDTPAGAHAFAWNGRNDAGAFVPRGTYRSVVTATAGGATLTQTSAVVADAFVIGVSDTTPARRQRITVTVNSAEGLKAAPRLYVYQPRASSWSVTMTRTAPGKYKATITLRSSRAGTLRLKVAGVDSLGHAQYTNLSLPLR